MTETAGLIADIGATNARFAMHDGTTYRDERVFKCADYPSLVAAARAYLNGAKIRVGAFAVAGPVTGDWVSMTNHPWDFSIEKTKTALGLSSLVVMNDFEAVARGVPLLSPSDVVAVGGDQKPIAGAPIGIVGPGTGLGIAALVMGADGQYVPVPGEGGHVTAAAQTQREFDVIKILHQKYRHVSVERVCSGKGLVNLYQALRVLDGRNDLPETLEAEEISRRAMESRCPVCAEALDMMMAFLGNVSGNLALTLNAFGGVYLAGGICLQLGEGFMNSRFRAVFEAKGRYEDYLRQVPTYLIRHPYIAFVGLGGVIRANS